MDLTMTPSSNLMGAITQSFGSAQPQAATPAPTQTPLFGVPMNNAPAAPQGYVEEDGKHKGVAGVGRDVLGFLGDFLLTKLGMGPMYGPAQQRRKLGVAMEDFDTNPLAAIQQVTSIDPAQGAKLREQYIDNQRLAAAQASTAESREARLQLAKNAQDDKTRTYAGSFLGTMATWDDAKREAHYPSLRNRLLRYGQAKGLDLSQELPETFDPVALDAFIDATVPVGTQRSQRLSRERLEETIEQNDVRNDQTERRMTETETQNDVRNSQAETRMADNRSNNAANRAARASEGAANRAVRQSEGAANRQSRARRQPPVRARTGEVRRIGGRDYTIRDGRVVPVR